MSPATLPAPCLIGCGPSPTSPQLAPEVSPGVQPGVQPEVPPPEAIGFKAHNLARMAALGLRVPPAFVLGTAWCQAGAVPQPSDWHDALAALERASHAQFGDPRRPLLLSVRSGAPVSMPGMMETLLNIGLCDATVPGLLRSTGNPRLVWDAYRRLVASYGETVLGLDAALFEADLQQLCAGRDERELDFTELRTLTHAHLASVQAATGQPFPQQPQQQLQAAINAVLASWQAPKARDYRRLNQLPGQLGTAVTVQRMVFGNAGGTSGAGVGFTRHPSSGEPQPWVDFLFNAQGEDVVSGRRSTPGQDELAQVAPALWAELLHATKQLEQAFGDMQDFEFTVENGQLWLLQTRAGKRSALARARIALDLLDEGLIDTATARQRTDGLDAASLAVTRVLGSDSPAGPSGPLAQAISAAHGVACGELVLDEAQARRRHATGVPVLLLRHDAETRDLVALELACGLLTARGARTSHAAVVARQLGKVCLVACEGLQIDLAQRCVHFTTPAGVLTLPEGSQLTLDGHTGQVWRGEVHTVTDTPTELLARLDRLRQSA